MLQVRNMPDELHEAVRRRAAAEGLSMSDFVIRELERVVSHPPLAQVLGRAGRRGGRLSFSDALRALEVERKA